MIAHCTALCCVNYRNLLSHSLKKKFRQTNYLVISLLVKPLLSRNVCQKCVRVNLRNFHTVRPSLFLNFSLETLYKNLLFFKNILWNQFTVWLIDDKLLSRNFAKKVMIACMYSVWHLVSQICVNFSDSLFSGSGKWIWTKPIPNERLECLVCCLRFSNL